MNPHDHSRIGETYSHGRRTVYDSTVSKTCRAAALYLVAILVLSLIGGCASYS